MSNCSVKRVEAQETICVLLPRQAFRGLDALVFADGIGENAPIVRAHL